MVSHMQRPLETPDLNPTNYLHFGQKQHSLSSSLKHQMREKPLGKMVFHPSNSIPASEKSISTEAILPDVHSGTLLIRE